MCVGGREGGALKALAQTIIHTCRYLSMKIECYNDIAAPPQPRPSGNASTSTPGGTSRRIRRSAGDREVTPEDEDEDEDEDEEEEEEDMGAGLDFLSTSTSQP
ncbi:hypothetical protein BS78_01G491100 [Paspalum vaginatum]|nr:hypothetical protein BS78_01G491100 [Paspalum vaginatum]